MKTKFLSIFLTFSLVSGIYVVGYSQAIKVKVQNIRTRQGIVHVALCNNADDFMTEKYKELTSKVSPTGEASVDFTDIPKGKYAIRVYQDTDNSGDLTTNIIGLPEEPFGFSNNPRIKMGPPAFSSASFEVKNDVSLTIRLLAINL
jgi:uncharacterized protein (DUF2141 family)